MTMKKISQAKNWSGTIAFDTWIPNILDQANIEDAFKAFYFGNIDNGNAYDDDNAEGEVGSLYHHLVSISASVSTVNNNFIAHSSASVNVHGIANTGDLATKTDAQNFADSAVSVHELDSTNIHGISDTSKLAKFGSSSAGRTLFVQSAEPTANAVGDIWLQVTGL